MTTANGGRYLTEVRRWNEAKLIYTGKTRGRCEACMQLLLALATCRRGRIPSSDGCRLWQWMDNAVRGKHVCDKRRHR